MTIWKELFDAGIFVNPVISPAVPEGSQLLRTSYMATHTDEQMSRVLETFAKLENSWVDFLTEKLTKEKDWRLFRPPVSFYLLSFEP